MAVEANEIQSLKKFSGSAFFSVEISTTFKQKRFQFEAFSTHRSFFSAQLGNRNEDKNVNTQYCLHPLRSVSKKFGKQKMRSMMTLPKS